MPKATMRTHIIIPTEVVESVDSLVGKRGRSKFVADAVEEKLARVRLAKVAQRVAGSLGEVDIPGWESSEAAAEWVARSRRADHERLQQLLREAP